MHILMKQFRKSIFWGSNFENVKNSKKEIKKIKKKIKKITKTKKKIKKKKKKKNQKYFLEKCLLENILPIEKGCQLKGWMLEQPVNNKGCSSI